MRLVAGAGAEIGAWVARHLDLATPTPPFTALGWMDDADRPIGGVIFNNYTRGANINATVVWKGKTFDRATLAAVMKVIGDYAFEQLACRRITITTRAGRADVIRKARALGFQIEGYHPHYFADDDGVTLGILKQDWRW